MNDVSNVPTTGEPADDVLKAPPKLETQREFVLQYPVHDTISGTTIDRIVLRIPSTFDLTEIGGPPSVSIWTKKGMAVEMDAERTKAWILRLSEDLTTPLYYKIPARDTIRMFHWIDRLLTASGN